MLVTWSTVKQCIDPPIEDTSNEYKSADVRKDEPVVNLYQMHTYISIKRYVLEYWIRTNVYDIVESDICI